jgi:Domain of unknown function (DUF4350)
MTLLSPPQGPARGTAGPDPVPAQVPGTGISPTARDAWHRWRSWLMLAAVVLVGGTLIALIAAPHTTSGYLDPGNPGSDGARAVAAIAAQRGYQVTRVTTVGAAATAASGGRSTLVVTSPWLLTTGELTALARVPGDRLLIEPNPASLTALAPGVSIAGAAPAGALDPGCTLPAATLAGHADLGGTLLQTGVPGAWQCYWSAGHPSLVRYGSGGRTIIVLGSGAPFRNGELASLGNAALALNLLGGPHQIVWLVPGPPPAGAGSTGQKPLFSLIPLPAYLVTIQIAVAAVLCALWRTRRLGPLVPERLPAVVRAAETVEGHGRLYRSRRSRDQAAAALRGATRSRLAARLGLEGGAERVAQEAMIAAVTARAGGRGEDVAAVLFGPAPENDAALVRLADALDSLERKVCSP